MALAGQGVLAIWNGVAPEAEADFVSWHVREHIPERVALDGFLRARRYVAVAGRPKYFNFYETDTTAALTAPGYLARLNAPSDWTRSVVRHFTDTSRTICTVALSEGLGDGAFAGTLRLSGPDTSAAVAEVVRTAIAVPLLAEPGIVGVHLLRGEPDAGGQTAEKALRSAPDRAEAWILLVEGTAHEVVARALDGLREGTALASAGLASDEGANVYRLEYALHRDQLP